MDKSKHDGGYRGFYVLSQAWYGNANMRDTKEEIMMGIYHPDGGTTGEFAIRWIDLGGSDYAPRLEVFGDAWSALPLFHELLAWLPMLTKKVEPLEVITALLAWGVTDKTPRDNPNKAPPTLCHLCKQPMPRPRPDGKGRQGYDFG